VRGLFKVEYEHETSLDNDVATAVRYFLFASEHKNKKKYEQILNFLKRKMIFRVSTTKFVIQNTTPYNQVDFQRETAASSVRHFMKST
jgi:hypothetical protein